MAYRKHNWQILVKHEARLHTSSRFNLSAQSGTQRDAQVSLPFTCSVKSPNTDRIAFSFLILHYNVVLLSVFSTHSLHLFH